MFNAVQYRSKDGGERAKLHKIHVIFMFGTPVVQWFTASPSELAPHNLLLECSTEKQCCHSHSEHHSNISFIDNFVIIVNIVISLPDSSIARAVAYHHCGRNSNPAAGEVISLIDRVGISRFFFGVPNFHSNHSPLSDLYFYFTSFIFIISSLF